MPGTKRPESPLGLLRVLEKRVRILEQARRLSSLIGAQVNKNSNQTIATGIGSPDVVAFAQPVDFDTDAYFDNASNGFIIPDDLDGYYWVYAKIEWANGTGETRIRIRTNTVAFTEFYGDSNAGAVNFSQPIGIVKYLNAGDVVSLAASHNQGTNRNVIGSSDDFGTYFGLYLVGQ